MLVTFFCTVFGILIVLIFKNKYAQFYYTIGQVDEGRESHVFQHEQTQLPVEKHHESSQGQGASEGH